MKLTSISAHTCRRSIRKIGVQMEQIVTDLIAINWTMTGYVSQHLFRVELPCINATGVHTIVAHVGDPVR